MTGEGILEERMANGHRIDSRKSSIDSDGDSLGPCVSSRQPSSKTLLIKMANDYSHYLKTDLSFEITKVEEFVEECIAKLEEFQSLFDIKENERKSWTTHVLPDLIRTGTLLSITLSQRLDTLACLILSIQCALDTLEARVSEAESRFGIHPPINSASTIRSVFKYFIKAEEQGLEQGQPKNKKKIPALTFEHLKGPEPLQLSQFFH